MKNHRTALVAMTLLTLAVQVTAQTTAARCEARTGAKLNPVIELYTSEGCSSCPPADQWLSTLKPGQAQTGAVLQAFHVGYWDYIGWVDRFASPAYTQRQRDIAAMARQRNVYTPQLVKNGLDWKDYSPSALSVADAPRASIALKQTAANAFEAAVNPVDGSARWGAYWTVTESNHSSKVKSGENAGEFLKHDFVVRQYTLVGDYKGPQTLKLDSIKADPEHPRQVNVVVYDLATGKPLQALGASCS